MSSEVETITVADVIVESMPFADELIAWCYKHPEFKEGLKVANPVGFIALLAVSTSGTTNASDDEVIGIFAYDMDKKIFKQDFIVNVGGKYEKFMLYSKVPNKNYGLYVQHINQFYAEYGKNGHYANTHHYTPERLAIEFAATGVPQRAEQAVALADRLAQSGRRQLTQAELKDLLTKVREAKRLVRRPVS